MGAAATAAAVATCRRTLASFACVYGWPAGESQPFTTSVAGPFGSAAVLMGKTKAPDTAGVVRPSSTPLHDTSTFKKPSPVPSTAIAPETEEPATGEAIARSQRLVTGVDAATPFANLRPSVVRLVTV